MMTYLQLLTKTMLSQSFEKVYSVNVLPGLGILPLTETQNNADNETHTG